MNKYFISIFILFAVFACSSDIYTPQPDGTVSSSTTTTGGTTTGGTTTGGTTTGGTTTGGTTSTTAKCYLNTIENVGASSTTKSSFSYTTAGLIDKFISQGSSAFIVTYDKNNNPIKAVDSQDSKNFVEYLYDTKGGLTTINVNQVDDKGKVQITTYSITTNSKLQAVKVVFDLNFLGTIIKGISEAIEYDANGNITKITTSANGTTTVSVQNTTFDDKTTPFYNAGVNKIFFYGVALAGALGANFTNYINKNNILSDKTYFNSAATNTYTYEYNSQGYPTKSIGIKKDPSLSSDIKTTETYTYTCK